jgi:NDP-sugar pyrophosphorylase family protein
MDICGVILAAGRGERIKPLSFTEPKPLLPVGNMSIVEHQVKALEKIGVREFYIVVGHLKDRIVHTLGDGSSHGFNITYIDQEHPLGIAHALAQLEGYIRKPFFTILGDLFFIPKDLSSALSLFERKKASAVLTVIEEKKPEEIKRNFTVVLAEEGRVMRVIEKPRHIQNNLVGFGIYLFDVGIFDAIRRTPRTAMRDEYEITDSLQILIDDGHPVYTTNVVEWICNVTYPEDLLLCNEKQLSHLNLKEMVGEGVEMAEGVRLVNSVVGNRVKILHPIEISDSVIFSDVLVSSKVDMKRCLLTQNLIIDCEKRVITQEV